MATKKLKDWFDEELAESLAEKIKGIRSDFSASSFVSALGPKIVKLELKDRIEAFADELHHHLNENYARGIEVLLQILGPENPKETGMFTEFYWIMPIAKYVEKYGLQDYAVSMKAIEEISKRNTGEYSIRPYLEAYPKKTLAIMESWAKHENSHMRRLASEGLRPRLPWAPKLNLFIKDPRPVFPILDKLKDDPSKYVQKSVANCLNDILKDNVDLGKRVIEEWNQKEIGKERRWIIKHALRNLLKSGDDWAKEMIS